LAIVRIAPAIVGRRSAVRGVRQHHAEVFCRCLPSTTGFSQSRALAAVVVVFMGDATLQFAAGWLADRFGHARVHRTAGVGLCVLLPLLP